jgi:hypothetical protein
LTEIIIWNFMENKKEMHLQGSLVAGRFLSLFHRWIMLIVGYVVRVDVNFILDSGDRNIFLRQGCVHVEQ